jgi:hypothetical protein
MRARRPARYPSRQAFAPGAHSRRRGGRPALEEPCHRPRSEIVRKPFRPASWRQPRPPAAAADPAPSRSSATDVSGERYRRKLGRVRGPARSRCFGKSNQPRLQEPARLRSDLAAAAGSRFGSAKEPTITTHRRRPVRCQHHFSVRSISRTNPAGALPPSCSRATKRGGLLPTSPSCRSCWAQCDERHSRSSKAC